MPAAERKLQATTSRPRVSTYLTLEEMDVLDAAAERLGLSRSEMLRLLVRNAMFLVVGFAPDPELPAHLVE